jgi:hypothetical protein
MLISSRNEGVSAVTKEMKPAAVDDVIGAMEEIAPPKLAENWDNVGLQVGDGRWDVRREVRAALS